MPHHRARFTARGRGCVWFVLVDDGGHVRPGRAPPGERLDVDVWEWVRRWRAASPAEQRRWPV